LKKLPTNLYSAKSVTLLDQIAINDCGIPGYTLMRRAGQAVLDALLMHYADAKTILVLCGAGNNAGDGYVLARLAQAHGLDVRVISMIDPGKLRGDARQAWQHWQECGETLAYQNESIADADIIIDALLGTGLTRDVEGDWKTLIQTVNQSGIPVLAVDIPPGLMLIRARFPVLRLLLTRPSLLSVLKKACLQAAARPAVVKSNSMIWHCHPRPMNLLSQQQNFCVSPGNGYYLRVDMIFTRAETAMF